MSETGKGQGVKQTVFIVDDDPSICEGTRKSAGIGRYSD